MKLDLPIFLDTLHRKLSLLETNDVQLLITPCM